MGWTRTDGPDEFEPSKFDCTSDTKAVFCICPFLMIFFSKIYDIRDDFDFEIVNFPFLDGDV